MFAWEFGLNVERLGIVKRAFSLYLLVFRVATGLSMATVVCSSTESGIWCKDNVDRGDCL